LQKNIMFSCLVNSGDLSRQLRHEFGPRGRHGSALSVTETIAYGISLFAVRTARKSSLDVSSSP
jgi:hypothetical protein